MGLLFLADRLIHLGQAEHSLASINSNNIARYLTSTSLSALERAADKASAANGNPFVYLAKFLIENRDIREMLVRLDVEPKEFEQKIDDFLKEAPKETEKNFSDIEILLKKSL